MSTTKYILERIDQLDNAIEWNRDKKIDWLENILKPIYRQWERERMLCKMKLHQVDYSLWKLKEEKEKMINKENSLII